MQDYTLISLCLLRVSPRLSKTCFWLDFTRNKLLVCSVLPIFLRCAGFAQEAQPGKATFFLRTLLFFTQDSLWQQDLWISTHVFVLTFYANIALIASSTVFHAPFSVLRRLGTPAHASYLEAKRELISYCNL